MSLSGLRVLSLESRRATETAELIRRQDGEPVIAPSMREVPLEDNHDAIRFGERLLAGEFDMTIFLTGVGTRILWKVLDAHFPPEATRSAVAKTTIVVRGPKPAAAIRELGLAPALNAPEPNTWHEILGVLKDRQESRIAIQEYGRPSTALYDSLRARGADVMAVPVYQWALPQDIAPLENDARELAGKRIDVVLLTSSIQVTNLLETARGLGIETEVLEGLRHAIVGSVGPTTSDTLIEAGLEVDFEPPHPKLGMLVREAAERAPSLVAARYANESAGR
jgi:uroporphyrinogen-III synthase